jgi:hypothetical protein
MPLTKFLSFFNKFIFSGLEAIPSISCVAIIFYSQNKRLMLSHVASPVVTDTSYVQTINHLALVHFVYTVKLAVSNRVWFGLAYLFILSVTHVTLDTSVTG